MPETRNQLLRRAAALPDGSVVRYRFADGWTLRQLVSFGDMHREGKLMRHCWQRDRMIESARDVKEALARRIDWPEEHWSLRDPDNLPTLSFFLYRGEDAVDELCSHFLDPPQALVVCEPEAARQRPWSAEQRERLAEWARSQALPVFVKLQEEDLIGVVEELNDAAARAWEREWAREEGRTRPLAAGVCRSLPESVWG